MNTLHDRETNPQSQNVAADLAASIAVIFEQYPMLCGFSVQERFTLTQDRAMVELPGGLCLADVAVSAPSGFRATQEFCREIAYMLLELIHEQPEVFGLLPGRTFARTLH